jgi:serine protease
VLPSRRRHAARHLLLSSIALSLLASPALAAGARLSTDYDQFIVKFKDGSVEHASAARRQVRLDAAGHAQGLEVGQLRRLAVGAEVIRTSRVLDAAGVRAFIARLRADPRVEYAEVDTRVAAHFVPNDPFYASQWHYPEAVAGIGTESAWGLADGNGQVVAVLDTGITAHSDLAGNVIAGYDFITSPFVSNDGDGRDADPSDPGDWVTANECLTGNAARNSSWHGTHVAGTVAAATNNAKGVAGVAFGAAIEPVRVLGKCGGAASDISDAIVWASGGLVFDVDPNPAPANVINLSLGGAGACGAATQAAIDVAVARGAVVVVSAGNNNADAANYTPANCNNVITVAAVGRSGARASYSNYGAVVDIAAPGGDGGNSVWSTFNAGTTTPGAESYAAFNGTSMAAPHVAGVAALIGDAANGTLDPAEIKRLIEATARPLPVACPQGCGAGLVDAATAVTMASQPLLTISDPIAAEGDAGTQVFTFTVSLSAPAASDVTYYASTSNGTAQAGTDFVANAWPDQVIPAGATSATYPVVVNGDTAAEIDETFSFVVGEVSGPVSVLEQVGTGTIVNDDGAAPDLAIGDATVTEGDSGSRQLAFTVSLSSASASPVTFEIATANGTALAGSDFVARALAADSIAPGQTSKTYNVTIKGDTTAENDEVFYVNLYNVSGAALVDDTGVGTISDDDSPTLSIGDAYVTEGDSGTKAMTFTVSLSRAAASPVEFDFVSYGSNNTTSPATGGVDFDESLMIDQVIPAGQLARTFVVTLHGDTVFEPNERLIAQIGNASVDIARAWSEGVILNDDGPVLSISDAGVAEGNSGTRSLVFTVSLSQASANPVSYSIQTSDGTAVAGSDYVGRSLVGEVIPAGQLARTFAVTLNGDTQVEGNETFFVKLSGIGGGITAVDAQARGRITNDDGPVLSIGDATLTEADSGTTMMTFTVSLSQAAPAPVTFDFATVAGTALAGPDYVPVSVTGLKIPAGQLAKVVSVPIRGDAVAEPTETFQATISMGNVSIKDGVGVGTLVDND